MYKLIALDMDGTLLKEDKTISKENYAAIQSAREKGVKIVLTTGRPKKGIESYLEELDLVDDDEYCITYNGSLIENSKTGEILTKTLMTLDDAHFLYELSKKLDVDIHALTTKGCISPRYNKYTELEVSMNNIPFEEVDFNTIDPSTEIVKFLFVGSEEKISSVIEQLPKGLYEKYTIVRSYPLFLEFLDKNISKGAAVKTLAERLGVKQSEVICIGDAGNDIHMIQYAGLGVAMGNAFPEVKKAANYITLTNEEDGVAHIIDKFILSDFELDLLLNS